MPLVQVTDVFNEPLDLWLSPNHQGTRRFVRKDDLDALNAASKRAAERASKSVEAREREEEAERDARAKRDALGDDEGGGGGDDDDDDDDVVLCGVVPRDDGDGDGAVVNTDASLVPRVALPAPVGVLGLLCPIPTVQPLPDRGADALEAAAEASRLFESEAGAPTVFVNRPSPNLICGACRDVFRDPVIANDGFTYCRDCVPCLGELDEGENYAYDKANLARDHEIYEKIASLQILCRHGLTFLDTVEGVNRWVYNPEGCKEALTYENRVKHEESCAYVRARCALPSGAGENDSCPMMVYRFERASHQASCPFRLVPCDVPGCSTRVRWNRKSRHAATCEYKTTECANGCRWRGRRDELSRHRDACVLEVRSIHWFPYDPVGVVNADP